MTKQTLQGLLAMLVIVMSVNGCSSTDEKQSTAKLYVKEQR